MATATHMPRRGFLKAIPATALAPMAASAAPHPDAELLALCDAWWVKDAEIEADLARHDRGEIDDKTQERLMSDRLDERNGIGFQIAEITPQTIEGTHAQVKWLLHDYFESGEGIYAELTEVQGLCRIEAGLAKLAGASA